MHNQTTATCDTDLSKKPPHLPKPPPFELHPLDQEVLELSGSLPGLPLLVNPRILEELRDPPCSVHTLETSGRNSTGGSPHANAGIPSSDIDDSTDRQDYSYRGYLLKPRMDAYVRAREIYADVDGSFGGKFSSRLQECRKHAVFMQSTVTKKLRVMSSRCKLRWCPICRDVQRRIITQAVDDWLKVQKYPKMITLTLKHSDDPLSLQIKRLYDSFRKLLRRVYFRRLITGGVWFFQLKQIPATQQWHPHIHCLVAGKFLPQKKLKTLWHKITGDSYVVDIRPVHDLDTASTEVARYATSPADLTKVNLESALEIHYATKHRRICGSWGSAKSLVFKPTPQEDDDQWERVADFFFVNVSKEYDPTAKVFWRCFQKGLPYNGPQVQRLTDVYADELNILRSREDLPKTEAEWFMRIRRNRSKPWANFFKRQE